MFTRLNGYLQFNCPFQVGIGRIGNTQVLTPFFIGSGNDNGYIVCYYNGEWKIIPSDYQFPDLQTSTGVHLYANARRGQYGWSNQADYPSRLTLFKRNDTWYYNWRNPEVQPFYDTWNNTYGDKDWYQSSDLQGNITQGTFTGTFYKYGNTASDSFTVQPISNSGVYTKVTNPTAVNEPYGIYANSTGVQKVFGTSHFTDSNSNTYIRQYLNNTRQDKYDYICTTDNALSAKYFGGLMKWVIGTFNSREGWYEGEQPNVNNPVVFQFKYNTTPPVIKPDITITFTEYGAGLSSDVVTWYTGNYAKCL